MRSAAPLQTSKTLTGSALVQAFLEELAAFVRRAPGREVTGTRQEIVEDVVRGEDRFATCTVASLVMQLPQALGVHGGRYGLRYERLDNVRVKITAV